MSRLRFEDMMIQSGVKPIDRKFSTYRTWRGCAGKIQHRTEQAALDVIKKMYPPDREGLEVYPCDLGCGAYHIGHKKGVIDEQ